MEKQNNVSKTSRRRFIQRSAVGATILSLPAKSVWANGTVNSIVASGHGSDWASGTQISLRSHGYWKNHITSTDKVTFESIFGMAPLNDAGEEIVLPTYSGGFRKPKLHHVLKSEGDSGVTLPNVTDQSNVWVKDTGKVDSNNNAKHKFDLSGPDNVNPHMVAMYLNAKYDGMHGIYYPVVNSFGNLDNFIAYLKNAYNSDPGKLGVELAAIIDQCGTGCYADQVTV